MEIPEVDRAGWFTLEEALEKITKGQAPIVKALAEKLGVRTPGAAIGDIENPS